MKFYFAASKSCNLRCGYCYLPDENRAQVGGGDHLALEAAELFIQKAKNEGQSLTYCCLHGAETTVLSPDTVGRLANMFYDATGSRVKMQTNGINLTPGYVSRLLKVIGDPGRLAIGFSIDGHAEIHDIFRPSTWETVTNHAIGVRGAGFPCSILSVITPKTIDHLDRFAHWVQVMENSRIPVMFKMGERGHHLEKHQAHVFAQWLIDSNRKRQSHAFMDLICSNGGNDCLWYEFDLDGGVYSCNKEFAEGKQFSSWKEEKFTTIVEKRKELFQSVEFSDQCLSCAYWERCRAGCPTSRLAGKSIDCEIKKYVWAREGE